jgi:hypothetical protein
MNLGPRAGAGRKPQSALARVLDRGAGNIDVLVSGNTSRQVCPQLFQLAMTAAEHHGT